MEPLRVNAQRLWDALMELGSIGETPLGGNNRLALTDLDRQARDLVIRWCREAGCEVAVDRIGNIFARRPGKDNSLAPIATGSHVDTQPTGGKFDGGLGVVCGVEVLRTLADRDVETLRPIEVTVWTNEEGARFAPATIGSGVYAGVYDLDYAMSREDPDGVTIGEALLAIGYDGEQEVGDHDFGAFLEVHIEQGPILEANGKTIGVVSGAQSRRWFEVTVTGQDAHAGTTPMERRRDALLGASRIVAEVNRIGASIPDGRSTVGMMQVHPNSRNTIPGRVFFTIDLRHPDEALLADMVAEMREYAAGIARETGLEMVVDEVWTAPALRFDERAKAAIAAQAEALGYGTMPIVSGAGHDACNIAVIAPAAMIFIPCADGISHNETESATPEDSAAGCDVLLNAMLQLANER